MAVKKVNNRPSTFFVNITSNALDLLVGREEDYLEMAFES